MAYNRKDRFYHNAQAIGYRSRAAFKLLELSKRYRLLRAGDHVVDLGAWPGSWLQVAMGLVGPSGMVVGVDTHTIESIGPNVSSLEGDVRDPGVCAAILDRVKTVDVVLSDLAPKLTGIRARDEAQIEELAVTAISFATRVIRPGGRFLMKTFTIPELQTYLNELRPLFRQVKVTRPEATRSGSSEIYVVALDRTSLTRSDTINY